MTATATRATAWLLLAAFLVLGVCAAWRRSWERTQDSPTRPVVAVPARVHVLEPGGAGMVARWLFEARTGGLR